MSNQQEDLLPEETAGFKVGEKKTLNEIQSMGMKACLLLLPQLDNTLASLSQEPPDVVHFRLPSVARRYGWLLHVTNFSNPPEWDGFCSTWRTHNVSAPHGLY